MRTILLYILCFCLSFLRSETETETIKRINTELERVFPGSQILAEFPDTMKAQDEVTFHSAVKKSLSQWNIKTSFDTSDILSRSDAVLPIAVLGLNDPNLEIENKRAYLELLWMYFIGTQNQVHDTWLIENVSNALVKSYTSGDDKWKRRVIEILNLYMSKEDVIKSLRMEVERKLGEKGSVCEG